MASNREKVIIPLSPMSAEKDELLLLACKQWNKFLWKGLRMQEKYWGPKTSGAKSPAHWRIRAMYQRRWMMAKLKGQRKIHNKLAMHALWQGMFSQTIYTPNTAFFVPGYMLQTNGSHIWMRLFPLMDLGFEFWGPAPYQIRVTRKREQVWQADYLIDP
jgi:hypothetical protein